MTADDFTDLAAPVTPCHRFTADGVAFTARVPLVPVRLPRAQASAAGQHVITSGEGRRRGRRPRVAAVPFALAGSWVFVVDRVEADGEAWSVAGELLCYVCEGDVAGQATTLAAAVQRDLPAAVEHAGDEIGPASPADQDPGPIDSQAEEDEDRPPSLPDRPSASDW